MSVLTFTPTIISSTLVCVLDAQPTEEEREVWNQVNAVLQDSESILLGLQAYKGAGQEIRDVRHISPSTQPAHVSLRTSINATIHTFLAPPPGAEKRKGSSEERAPCSSVVQSLC